MKCQMTYCCQNEGKKANRTATGLSRVTACVSKIVASNAVGLLLNYGPRTAKQHNARAVAQAGLPARVVDGKPAVTLAKRMGFEEEYLMCWTWVLLEGRRGEWERDPLTPRTSRHSVMFSFCVDDWESEGREYVQRMIDRQ